MGPFTQMIQQQCNACNGSGKEVHNQSCSLCTKGTILEEKIFEVQIERGVESGKKIVFEEWGEQPSKDNEIAGSFIITINIDEHPDFKRRGNHLVFNIPLTFKESIVGKDVLVPHFSEEFNLDTRGFGIVNPNKEYIIFNKGMVNGDKTGNLHIKFQIEYKERTFSKQELDLISEVFDKVNF